MSDPLAHLYEVDDPGNAPELPTRTTSLEELVSAGPGDDVISDRDVIELAELVADRIRSGVFDDVDSVELGLEEVDVDGELRLTPIGRKVVFELFAHHPELVELPGNPFEVTP